MIALFEKEIKKLQSLKKYYLKIISSIQELNSLKKYYLKRIEALEELIEKLSSDCEGDNILQYDYDGDEKISIIDLTIISMAALGKLDNDERYDAENLTFNGKPLDLNNDEILNGTDVSTLDIKRSNEALKIDATISTYSNFDVSGYIENYYETNEDFPTLGQLQEAYNNYINAPEEIIVDEITYHKTQPENPGEGYELVTTEQNGVTYYAWVELSNVINGHEYVDLGLPSGTLWATMNIGAETESDRGYYYKYGYGAETYRYEQDTYYTGTEDPLDPSVDSAVQVWGGQWHMPTRAQFVELIANTDYTWTNINDVDGCKFTSKTDNSKYVFFPAAGWWFHTKIVQGGITGNYWSSSPLEDNDNRASSLKFSYSEDTLNVRTSNTSRLEGGSVRPVCTIETSQI